MKGADSIKKGLDAPFVSNYEFYFMFNQNLITYVEIYKTNAL